MKPLILTATAAMLLAGCSTELDINADYKDITVVYGLLNQRDSVHLVKINKGFLGEGNALEMALVADSNEYGGEAISLAVVERLDANGNVLDTYNLQDTLIENREPGVFNAPQQRMFYFVTPFFDELNTGRMFLDQEGQYRIRLIVNGKEITSTTPIVNDFPIHPVDQDTGNVQTSRVNLMNNQGTDYGTYEFNWENRRDCKRYVVYYRFRYDEVRGTDTIPKTFTSLIGTRVSSNSSVSEDLSVTMDGLSFFSSLSSTIKTDPTWGSVSKRIFRGMDFLVSVANDDFHTYLTLTEPVSGIVEDRPDYSNLTNAFGIWGSRYTKNIVGKRLNGNTLTELVEGVYTSDLNFCSALDPGGSFSCN